MTIILIFIIILEILLLFYLNKHTQEHFERNEIELSDEEKEINKNIEKRVKEAMEKDENIDLNDFEQWKKHVDIKNVEEAKLSIKLTNILLKDADDKGKERLIKMKEYANEFLDNEAKNVDMRPQDSNNITTTVKPSNSDIEDEEIEEEREEEDLPQEIVEKERLERKDDKLDLNKLQEKLKQSQKLTYTDYINYHKDWIVPPSKPYTCSPPQKYKNTPFVEYKISNK